MSDENAPTWVQSVTPAEIVRQRQHGWPDFHPEDFCHICGHRNPVWSAPAEDWDAVIYGHGGIFCPSCFATLYEAATGTTPVWWFRRVHRDDSARLAEITEQIRYASFDGVPADSDSEWERRIAVILAPLLDDSRSDPS